MELVTGRGGEDHISSADIASMLRGVYSDADVVLPLDDDLALTILSANTAQVGKGGCMLQGHFARVETAEQLVIESGAPGFNRNDLIVARYTLGDNNIQAVYLAVIKGTAVAGTASDPAYVDGSIDDGDTLVEFPLWRVPIAGVNVGTPERIMPTVDTLQDQIAGVRDSVSRGHSVVNQVSSCDGFLAPYSSGNQLFGLECYGSNGHRLVFLVRENGCGVHDFTLGHGIWDYTAY